MARKILLIVFALLITGSTIFFVRSWVGQQKQPVVETVETAPVKADYQILVVSTDLPAGTLVQEKHLKWQPWPESDDIEEIYVVEEVRTLEEFVGTVVRQGIGNGEPVTDSRFIKPGEQGFLAAVLNPGKRAISIPINATSGIAGFVFPGDRVDVILTHGRVTESESEEDGTATRRASETILTNARVIAMDQSTNDQEQQASVRGLATLEVTPKQVEILTVAKEMGRLSLSLRSLAQVTDERKSKDGKPVFKRERGRGHTWDSEASSIVTGPRRTGIPTTVINVVRAGDAKQKLFD
ncbi:Flp pilus assembly protein CpaB [Sneathiella marina]|uniref:Flp pilus assembly protein CpaB n=1 Tax=Sneathiella marina TaxID=2950108 RepID=A0ABY4WAK0_9PROT|nr:Flp pilus assembly protein CpaB [Sneathiella marina]USG62942.1 Flp pilus assembly protein CpaB [Sneathiella marina]